MIYKESGIYLIVNIVNWLVYVGSTSNLQHRWVGGHRSLLRNNKHNNSYLQNAWNKYGEKAFQFIVIEKTAKSNLKKREQHWIDFYDACNPKKGYNIQPQAGIYFHGPEVGIRRWKRDIEIGVRPHYKKEFWEKLNTATKTMKELMLETGLKRDAVQDYLRKFNLTYKHVNVESQFKKGHISSYTGDRKGIANGNMKFPLLQDYNWCLEKSKEGLTAKQIANLAGANPYNVYFTFKKFNLSFVKVDTRFQKQTNS